MAISIKKLTLWSNEIANRPGTLGQTLRPLAEAGVNLGVVMAYDKPDDRTRSVIEVAPVTGAKATRAAQAARLSESKIPCLLVEGDNGPGIGHAMTEALGAAGVNIHFTMALAVGKRFRTVFGFGPEANLDEITRTIRTSVTAAGGGKSPRTTKRAAVKPAGAKRAGAKRAGKTRPKAAARRGR
jgi:hypothetical protein